MRGARHAGKARLGFGPVVVVALTMLTWPVTSVTPLAGLDNSWQAGLSLALARGLVFGRQVVFTYGPLGLVTEPRAVTGGTLSWGCSAPRRCSSRSSPSCCARCAAGSPGRSLRSSRCLGSRSSCRSHRVSRRLTRSRFGLVAIALAQPPARARQAARTLALAGGVLAGLALLVKFNDGIGAAAIVAVGLLGRRGPSASPGDRRAGVRADDDDRLARAGPAAGRAARLREHRRLDRRGLRGRDGLRPARRHRPVGAGGGHCLGDRARRRRVVLARRRAAAPPRLRSPSVCCSCTTSSRARCSCATTPGMRRRWRCCSPSR